MRMGYASWTFAADRRYRNGQLFSSPDSALLYFFSILHGFQEAGYETWRLFSDRDFDYVRQAGREAFSAFSQKKRYEAYSRAKTVYHWVYNNELISDWPDLDFVLLDYRMRTVRNTLPTVLDDPRFDVDLLLQERLIEHYTSKNTPIICLDLDYLMEHEDSVFHYVLEPGFSRGIAHHFDFPFYIEDLLQFPTEASENKIAYVGNRYNRDRAFNQFFGNPEKDITFEVWGNWLEAERDSKERWPHIDFKGRAQPYQIREAYRNALAVPLLLKDNYNEHGFMTVRPIEVLLFGSIPLLPTDFNSPIYYPFPKIKDQESMIQVASQFKEKKAKDSARRAFIDAISFHDVKYFIKKVESVL